MQRIVQPEILDSLLPDDPAALANRRDLKTYNFLMGNFRWVRKLLAERPLPGGIIELGAGDGSLGSYLLGRKILSPESNYRGIDFIPRPTEWPDKWRWTRGDLLKVDYNGSSKTLIANMILHQFEASDLRHLGGKMEQSGIKRLIICEPVRRPLHLWQVGLSRILGMHAVTLHDARVSIHAGFRRDEVVDKLGLDRGMWSVSWSEHFLGANRIVCERL